MSGTKRKTGSKSSKAPSDFKRLKAKVGKKALRPVNETDTQFKKAALHVSGQSIVQRTKAADDIISQRGKSLADLTLQASHPAAQARQSAVKGLISILNDSESVALRAHLHTFVQVASKCLVDEDEDVRKVGFELFEVVLKVYDTTTLFPFLSLMVAYTTSALHSLDRDMRLDGTKAVHLIANLFERMIANEMAKSLLSPFPSILSERMGKKSLSIVLDSLVALLASSSSNATKQSCKGEPIYNFDFQKGGRSRNAFILQNKSIQKISSPLSSIEEVFGAQGMESAEAEGSKATATSAKTATQIMNDVQKQLCDILVGMQQDEEEGPISDAAGRNKLSFQEARTVIHALYLIEQSDLVSNQSRNQELGLRTGKLLLDLFPMEATDRDDAEKVNALLTKAVLQLTNSLEDNPSTKGWLESILGHWLLPTEKEDPGPMPAVQVEVLDGLLKALSTNRKKQFAARHRIIQSLYRAFFASPSDEISRSLAGRKAALSIAEECHTQLFLQKESGTDEQRRLLSDTACKLVYHLRAWSDDFEAETDTILKVLSSIARSVPLSDEIFLSTLRTSLMVLFDCQTDESDTRSIFERYPKSSQRSVLGLIRMLGCPSSSLLKALATICAAEGDERIQDEIFVAVFSIRKTISMVDFLGFLVSSAGLSRHLRRDFSDADVLRTSLVSLDQRLARTAKAAIECGTLRVFRMIMPQLISWMDWSGLESQNALNLALRYRAAICIFASLLLDVQSEGKSLESICPEACQLVERCQAGMEHFFVTMATNEVESERFISPFVALSEIMPEVKTKIQILRKDDVPIAGCTTDRDMSRFNDLLKWFE